jgi:hypothetical protein
MCCFFKLDFSMCPLRVFAANTDSAECAVARLVSIRASALCVSGIVRRAFSVFPKGTRETAIKEYGRHIP